MKIKDAHIYFFLALAVYVYVIIRAAILPVNIDEAGTFFYYINTDSFIPFTNDYHWTANNHILNTALAWLGVKIFGVSAFSLRIGSVLFFAIYLIYTYLFSLNLNNRHLKWLFRIFFITTTGFIEFFSLSRGYAISLACVMAGFYHLQKFIEYIKLKQYIISILYFVMASVANLNSIILLAIIIFTVIILFIINFKNVGYKIRIIYLFTFLMSGIILLSLKSILDKLKNLKELMHGSDIDNINDVLHSLASSLFLIANHTVVYYSIIITVLSCFIGWMYLFFKRKKYYEPYHIFIFFIACVSAHLFLKIFLNVNLPKDRTTIQLFFVLMISFFLIADYIIPYIKIKKAYLLVLFLPCILVGYSLMNVNFKYPNFIYYTFIPAPIYQYIAHHAVENTTISSFQNCDMIWGIQNIINNKSIPIQQTNFPNKDCHYIISRKNEEKHFLLNTDIYKKHYTLIWQDESLHGYALYKKNKPPELTQLFKKSLVHNNFINAEFINICDTILNLNANFNINTRLQIACANRNIFSWFVVDVSDINNNNLIYEYSALDRLNYNYKNTVTLNASYNFIKPITDTLRIKAYIWNIKHQNILVNEANMLFSTFN
jgi:hypothetical protein